jgi:hypothetical protein
MKDKRPPVFLIKPNIGPVRFDGDTLMIDLGGLNSETIAQSIETLLNQLEVKK